ncbi:MAG: A/G-specific adenine glycosylase, partial [Bacteroidetes bacterium]|nr:A/G-specific adenine glycosylase [Bacteroidota bacterium]
MFTRALFAWFRKNARSLPWRQTSNPYYILLSEIMLQQTQVSRVIPKYLEFIHRYPTLHHVAAASKAEIIHIWSGMGYNNRALRLRELAEILVTKNNGIIPSTPEELIKLPGIGKYTAHAVASFAFKKRVPVVDTNIDRVLKRCFPQWCKEQSVWEIARALLPQKRSHVWNQALMELGSLCCTSQSPRCNTCPWEQWCAKDIQYQQRKNSKRTEPSFRGIPNRLYRGKIVQFLRQHHKATFDDLAEFFSLSRNEYNWLQSLLQKMENDGIINIRA